MNDDLAYRLHCFNRDWTNLSLYKYRDFQGFLVTGKHSGTHWIKWMLTHAISHQYDVPPPQYYDARAQGANDIIGHPRHKRKYPHVPRLASSHSVAHVAMAWPRLRSVMPMPAYAVIVRDIHDILLSNYEKWKHRYQVDFSTYLKGDPLAQDYYVDAWSYVHFLNRWGDVAQHIPSTLVLRYEDFKTDRAGSLQRLARHFELDLDEESLQAGLAAGDKDFMAARHDPAIPVEAVRPDGKGDTHYTDADRAIVQRILDKHLKHDFGYDYFATPRGYRPDRS